MVLRRCDRLTVRRCKVCGVLRTRSLRRLRASAVSCEGPCRKVTSAMGVIAWAAGVVVFTPALGARSLRVGVLLDS
eukprot:8900393-Alexandrium_andersonii.AAC.1